MDKGFRIIIIVAADGKMAGFIDLFIPQHVAGDHRRRIQTNPQLPKTPGISGIGSSLPGSQLSLLLEGVSIIFTETNCLFQPFRLFPAGDLGDKTVFVGHPDGFIDNDDSVMA